MLMLLLQAGSQRYAVDSQVVVEVVPWASLYPLPDSPDTIVGLLNYHGTLVSVLDLGQLIHQVPSQTKFGTRIILVRSGAAASPYLGLLADRVVDTRSVHPDQLEAVGLGTCQAPYLGQAIVEGAEIIRCFHPEGIDWGNACRLRHDFDPPNAAQPSNQPSNQP
jgi:chemotaxis-related protein WspB